MCFFKVKHYFGHISGMVGPIDVKWKGSALDGFWVQYVTLTFDLTHDLDLGCFKVKFRNSSISGIVGLIDVKWKGSELIWYWADCMTLPLLSTYLVFNNFAIQEFYFLNIIYILLYTDLISSIFFQHLYILTQASHHWWLASIPYC